MKIVSYITTTISILLLSAHFFRAGSYGLFLALLIVPFMFFIKKRWSIDIISIILIFSIFEWIFTAKFIHEIYFQINIPSTKAILITISVAIFSFLSFLSLQIESIKNYYKKDDKRFAVVITGVITFIFIKFATIKAPYAILLLERFYPTLGDFEIYILSIYSMFITERMLNPKKTAFYRRLIWRVFSFVFFLQLILGLLGYNIFLMTGRLHLPIPTLIIAAPLYRFQLSFMIFLFLASLILSGPAWCSHLCYFGSFDDFSATRKKYSTKMVGGFWKIKISIVIFVIFLSLTLHFFNVSSLIALILASVWGVISIFIILYFSKKTGSMIHCTMFCPIGFFATTLGKISPFRLKIASSCSSCMVCTKVCRYGALQKDDITKKKANLNCTLCGDCLSTCKHNSI
ncbi:4Fe-4S binding protein, partial [bacterium]|nr:4Fe-4S binding protein [bacterium]